MAISIFDEKDKFPTEADIESALGESYKCWKGIIEFVFQNYIKTEAL
jgi:hypothetical protein